MALLAEITAFSFNLMFFVVFPVTFERSVTMFLLRKIEKKKELSKEEIEKYLTEEYVIRNKAVEKRMEEQSKINILKLQDNKIKLSSQGLLFLKISRFIEVLYNINQSNQDKPSVTQ